MFDAQRSKQPEHDRSQAVPTQKTSETKPSTQHTGDLTRIPLYTQLAWGNQPPPWLSLPIQRKEPHEEDLTQHKENTTGLPDTLKGGVEQLSGLSMDDVQVHYHSSKPAEVQALAYTRGTEIHVGPGQERHLPHEAWHVVQQAQGRVQPTMQLKNGVPVNDDEGLEHEATEMGAKALVHSAQLQGKPTEDELLHDTFENVQHQGTEEVELLQGKFATVQYNGLEEQGMPPSQFASMQRKDPEGKRMLGAVDYPRVPDGRRLRRISDLVTASGPVQLVWGQYNPGDREAARGILMVVGQIDPFNYALAGVLEELINEGVAAAQLQAALNQMPNDFTSAVRARTLTNFLQGGAPLLPVGFAQVAVLACPMDNGTLGPLLGLFQQLHAAGGVVPALGLAQVCSGLLTAGQPVPLIVNAVQNVAALLTTVPRATAILAHQQVGGTDADAQIAASFAPADATVLAEALTTLRSLAPIPNFPGLAQDKKEALLGERAYITTDVLRTNAVVIAMAAVDGPTATLELLRTRAFGYRVDFTARADLRAAGHQQGIVDAETQKIEQAAQVAQDAAIAGKRTDALAKLTRKEKKALDYPQSKEGLNANQKLQGQQISLASEDIDTINLQQQQDLLHVQNVTGPAANAVRKNEFQAWFQSIHFHPDALLALDAAGEDFALATRIIATILAQHPTRQLLVQSGLLPSRITRLLTLTAADLAALVGGGVTVAELQVYAGSNVHVNLLAALRAAGVPFANISSLVNHLNALGIYVNNPVEAGHMVILLVGNTPAEVVAMCNAAPNPAIGKMALLVAIRPKAALVADLVILLNFCKDAGWTHGQVTAVLGVLANGRTLLQLQSAVYQAELLRFDKGTQFPSWLYAVDRLIRQGYLTIQPQGVWVRLPGAPLTDEQNYNVMTVVGGIVQNTFCVHYHPGASGPTPQDPYASKSHLKPVRGGDVRYTTPNQLANVRPLIELRPPN